MNISLTNKKQEMKPCQQLIMEWVVPVVQLAEISSEAGVLDEPDSAKPAQWNSYTGPPGYKGWTQFQPM
jgi:hypothetical protein